VPVAEVEAVPVAEAAGVQVVVGTEEQEVELEEGNFKEEKARAPVAEGADANAAAISNQSQSARWPDGSYEDPVICV
jgi:hypothetical protein